MNKFLDEYIEHIEQFYQSVDETRTKRNLDKFKGNNSKISNQKIIKVI